MLTNTILGKSAINSVDFSTLRENIDGDALFIGTRVEKAAGQPVLTSVFQDTTLVDTTSVEGDFAKSSTLAQIKWHKPDPAQTVDPTIDYDNQNAVQLLESINYLFGLTIDSATVAAVTTVPFYDICGKQS